MKNLYFKIITIFLSLIGIQAIFGTKPTFYGTIKLNPSIHQKICVAQAEAYYKKDFNKKNDTSHIYKPLVPVEIEIQDKSNNIRTNWYPYDGKPDELKIPHAIVIDNLINKTNSTWLKKDETIELNFKKYKLNLKVENTGDKEFHKILKDKLNQFEIQTNLAPLYWSRNDYRLEDYQNLYEIQKNELINAEIIKQTKDGLLEHGKNSDVLQYKKIKQPISDIIRTKKEDVIREEVDANTNSSSNIMNYYPWITGSFFFLIAAGIIKYKSFKSNLTRISSIFSKIFNMPQLI